MEAVVHEALGDVQGRDFVLMMPGIGEHAFVHAGPVIGQIKNVLEAFLDVIGIQHGTLTGFLQFAAHGKDVGIGTGLQEGKPAGQDEICDKENQNG